MPFRNPFLIATAVLLIGLAANTVVADQQSRDGVAADLESRGRVALEAGEYEAALGLFESGTAEAQDEGLRSRIAFQQAYTLQQLSGQASEPETCENLLMRAAGLYEAYLEFNPNSATAANNLARVYEQIGVGQQEQGEPEQAAAQFSKAGNLYQKAIDSADSLQGLYLKNYAEMLDRTGEWQRAKTVYARIVREQPLSTELQQSIADAHAKRGLDDLADYLWELFNAGFVQEASVRALDTLEQTAGASGDSRVRLLTLVPAALAKETGDASLFPDTETGQRLAGLGTDIFLGRGAEEVLRLHRGQELGPGHYGWWAQQESGFYDDSANLHPADSFRALIRSLGSRAKLAGKVELAAGYFHLSAELQPWEIDPIAVRALVQMYAELNQPQELDRILRSYTGPLYRAKGEAYRSARVGKIFQYHQTLGELYALIERWGDSDTVASAIFQLEHARQVSIQMESSAPGSLPREYQFTPGMTALLARAYTETGQEAAAEELRREEAERYREAGNETAAAAVFATSFGLVHGGRPNPEPGQKQEPGQTQEPAQPQPLPKQEYIGDDIRVAVGYDSETDLTGEFFWNFREDYRSAYSFEGWKGADKSGGLKLNFHWLGGSEPPATDAQGKPFYSDGRVYKLFVAADRNMFGDGKVTFGGGSEYRDNFWSLYASRAATGERLIDRRVRTWTEVREEMTDDWHRLIITDSYAETTDYLAHPYDWGIGFRIGRHFESVLLRLRGGLDYESGDYSSSQATAYIGLDKRFAGTGHGLSLRAEYLRKRGDFEQDRDDARVSAFWSWDFGTTFRPSGAVATTAGGAGTDGETAGLESAWIRRALRNPIAHKRSVDYYRYNRVKPGRDTRMEVINTGPGAKDDVYEVCVNSGPTSLDILANDSDPEQDYLELVSVSDPSHGSVTRTGNEVSYAPEENFTGQDSFTYKIEDRFVVEPHDPGAPSEATVRITVVDCTPEPPDPANDSYEVSKYPNQQSLPVLENDTDPGGHYPLSILADTVTQPINGGSIRPNPTNILYTPPVPVIPGVPENCSDTFTYAIENAEEIPSEYSATVRVTVKNDLPVAMDDDEESCRNTPVTINVLANDADDDQLTIVDYSTSTFLRGQVTLNGNGTLTYTPNGEYWGSDTFQYTVRDYCGAESTATVTVVVDNTVCPVPSPGEGKG